jgi:hypothetical protein
MSALNLFGEAVAEMPPVPAKGNRKGTQPKGYAWTPGTGPEGETCKTCLHYVVKQYHVKTYRKCGLMESVWTHGPGSDILAKSPACKKWEAA